MDVAYPVRARRSIPDPLKWSIRSVAQNLSVDRVFIASPELPEFLDPRRVTWLQTTQTSKWQSIGANLRAVMESDISEDFIWMNDDIFVLDPMGEVPLTSRGSFDAWCDHVMPELVEGRGDPEHLEFLAGMIGQRDLLRRWGFVDPPCTDCHTPMPLNKTRLKSVLADQERDAPELVGHFRALYGAGLPSVEIRDPKLKRRESLPEPDWWCCSTSYLSWRRGVAGVWLRSEFPLASRFEIGGPT